MKNMSCFITVLCLILVSFTCLAAQEGKYGTTSPKKVTNEENTRNMGENTSLTIQQRTETGSGEGTGIGRQIRNESMEIKDGLVQERDETRDRLKNMTQDQIRNMTGERGVGVGVVLKNESRQTKQELDQLRDQTRDQLRDQSRDIQEIRERIREQSRILNQSMTSNGPGRDNAKVNQNRVRLAVHALLEMENRTGGIGRNVSMIAREFNNSLQAAIRAEERMQARSGIERLFLGGDEKAAAEALILVEQNRVRIMQLNQLMNEFECTDEMKSLMQEQIRELEREQTRLTELARKEKQDKGILGWLFK